MTAQTMIDLEAGLPVGGSEKLPAFCHPGTPRWHAIVAIPQREAATEAMLARHGVYSFYPVTTRVTTVRGKRRVVQSRYLPGYVFARFPGPVAWHRLAASPLVAGAVRHSSGEPAILHPADLRRIHDMRAVDEAEAERIRQSRIIRRGDRVRVLTGAFSDEEHEVLELAGGKVRLRMCFFGADVPVEVSLHNVEKISLLRDSPVCGSSLASAAL